MQMSYIKKPGLAKVANLEDEHYWSLILIPFPIEKLKWTKTVKNVLGNGPTHTHIQAHTHMIIFTESY